jgi:F-type H+-transporting ATPase subunit a
MAAQYANPSEYIGHHLTFLQKPIGDGGFWTLNVDTLVMSVLLGFVGIGFFWWIARGMTAGVPSRRQAFVEVMFDAVTDNVRGIFHGDPHKFVAPMALTVFVWVLLMNSMDFFPADLVALATHYIPHGEHGFRIVPTADVNTTFALALTVWALMIGFAFKVKGFGGFFHELFCAPFGSNPLLWVFNFLFNLVEYVSKPLSHSLRLFGNIYAGEIIFLLIWMLGATGIVGGAFAVALGWGWAAFHVLIVLLQAYIFMMLTIVYIAMAHESH